MRFVFQTSLFFILWCFAPAFTLAQGESSTSTASSTGGFFEAVIENVQNITNNVTEQVSPSEQSPLDIRTEERLTNLAANISNRLEGFTDRLYQISNRLKRRIDKLKQEGYDVSLAEASLAQANTNLDAARHELNTIDRDVYRAFRSTDPRTKWKEVRSKYVRTRDTIKTAHGELRNTLSHLKNVSKPVVEETASSTEPL